MLRQLTLCAALGFAMTAAVNAQTAPPASPEAKQIEALVNKAAAKVEAEGRAALPEMRKKGSEWYSGSLYVFLYDPNGTVLLQPAFPEREGKSFHGEKDKKGKAFHDEILKLAKTRGSGWIDYWLPKPGQTQPSQKWSYIKAVKIDGGIGAIGAGFYPD